MANNRLQLRRDSAQNFTDSALSTNAGEPILDTDTGRIRVDNLGGGGHLHQVQPGMSQTEGHPFHLLWNIQGYNNEPYLTVPPVRRGDLAQRSNANGDGIGSSYSASTDIETATSLTQASVYAASGSIPAKALQDAATIHVSAHGDYETGSSSPAMCFAFQLGNDEDETNQVRFSPKREPRWFDHTRPLNGTIPYGTPGTFLVNTGPQEARLPGIYISNDTHGPNILQYDTPFHWELDAKVEFLGHRGGSQFPSEPADAANPSGTVRVSAKVRWGLLSQHNSLQFTGKTIAGFRNSYRLGSTFDLEPGQKGYPYGWVHGSGDSAYQAVGPIQTGNGASIFNGSPGTAGDPADLDDLTAKYNALVGQLKIWFDSAPAIGDNWQDYFRMVTHEEHFVYEEEVDLKQDDLTFSLMLGGPMQDDLNHLPGRWTATPAGPAAVAGGGGYSINSATAGFRQATIVRPETTTEGDACYAARILHNASDSYTPVDDPDDFGYWRRYWYKLADDRADKMRLYSSTAYMIGGRNGVSDFNPY